MSVYIDRKYLLLISSRLQQFKQKKEDLFNFRCLYCGDSKKNKLKARGYVYRKSNDYFYTCHNCNKSTTFAKFLQEVDSGTYKQYALERYAVGETGHHNYKKPDFQQLKGNAYARFQSTLNESSGDSTSVESLERSSRAFTHYCIENLLADHPARDYIQKRQIPKKHWKEIYFTEKFKDFLDLEFPQHGKDEVPNDERIVLFYTNEKSQVTNVAGRALSSKSKIRYVTVKISDEKKVFGLHRLRKQERVYVVEGQFDSLFLENSIASGDSNLGGVAAVLSELDVVLVYDNEPRNKDIVKQIEKSIDKGYKVCLFPEAVNGKDINEMILNGLTSEQIKIIINANTFSGLEAKLKFMNWKRC
jgi:transcription elongation factor Elf1